MKQRGRGLHVRGGAREKNDGRNKKKGAGQLLHVAPPN